MFNFVQRGAVLHLSGPNV